MAQMVNQHTVTMSSKAAGVVALSLASESYNEHAENERTEKSNTSEYHTEQIVARAEAFHAFLEKHR